MNKNTSFFGLLLMHSFKKMVLSSVLYIIVVLTISFIRFKFFVVDEFYLPVGRAVDVFRDGGVITSYKSIFLTSYFQVLSIIFFGYIAYVVISSSFKIFDHDSVANRINIPDKNIKVVSFIHYVVSIFSAFFVIVIAYYLMATLYTGYFDYGYLDKPYIYLRATDSSYLRLFFTTMGSLVKVIMVLFVGAIVYGFNHFKNENVKPEFAAIALTMLLVFFG